MYEEVKQPKALTVFLGRKGDDEAKVLMLRITESELYALIKMAEVRLIK